MTFPLEPDAQRQVDATWANMLTPVDRLDRDLLLDVVVTSYLYQLGVDTLHLTATKHLDEAGRIVTMAIDCDRASPATDQFTITIADGKGRTLRRERYTRADIEECGQRNTDPRIPPVTKDGSPPPAPDFPEAQQRRQAYERRQERIRASTQPARI
jgi:hypothetical protein